MKLVQSYEDDMNNVVTFELGDGRRVRLDRRYINEEGGVAKIIRSMGLGDELPTGRVDVYQHGKIVGTVAADFEPNMIKRGLMYEYRPGDYTRDASGWIASRMLGRGDFNYLPGFIPA